MTHKRDINRGAFLSALVLTHISGIFAAFALGLALMVITTESIWISLPIFAGRLGMPIFIIVGLPILVYVLRRRALPVLDAAALGFTTNLILGSITCATVFLINGRLDGAEVLIFGFGVVFAPLWAGTFAAFNSGFSSKNPSHPS